MKTLIIHGGPWKTGSTALQIFFALNRETFRKYGIHYPKGIVEERAQHEIAELLQFKVRFPAVSGLNLQTELNRIFSELSDRPADTLLLSSENFSSVPISSFQKMTEIAKDFGISKFLYFRFDFDPQVRFKSDINEAIRSGEWITKVEEGLILKNVEKRKIDLYALDSELQRIGFQVFRFDYGSLKSDTEIFSIAMNVVDQAMVIPKGELKYLPERAHKSLDSKTLRKLNEFNRLNRGERDFDLKFPILYSTHYPLEKKRLRIANLLILIDKTGKANLEWIAKSRVLPLILRFRTLEVLLERSIRRIYGGLDV